MANVSSQALVPFRAILHKSLPHFGSALPETVKRHMTPERLTRIALTALSRTPALLQCTPESFARVCLESAALGLEPGSSLGHMYIVPYKREATAIIGYRGYIELARRSGKISSIEAHVVYEHDEFEIAYGIEPKLVHKPKLKGERGELVAAYCVATFKDGTKQCEVMTREEVLAVRRRSRASHDGPWVGDEAEMWRKTVVRRAAKYWPLSGEIATAIEIDNRSEAGGDYSVVDVPVELLEAPQDDNEEPAPRTTKAQQLAEQLRSDPGHG